MKRLIIVESPSKAKTIKGFLGDKDIVVASKGHIRDLPKKTMGITLKEGAFIPQYEVSADRKKQVDEIKKLAKESDKIYIATDEDREGEAIGYHAAILLGSDPLKTPRIVFHEVTKSAILASLEHPRAIDMQKVNAQQARRLLDRIVGYNLSPLLSQKIRRGLSAGRVQSAALKIIVDREREIRAFKPEEYWSVAGFFEGGIEAELIRFGDEKIEKLSVKNEARANEIKAALEKASFVVGAIEKKERKISPPPPFMTSALQQTASSKLGFNPKKTMSLAQKLYEGVETGNGVSGAITYMRTDSLNIAPEANEALREAIASNYGDRYLAPKTRFFKNKSKGAQEAHEAIRPTNLAFTPAIAAKHLSKDEARLYTLIYNRFLATQMSDANVENASATLESDEGAFKVSGRRVIFDGFYKVLNDDEKDKLLPDLKSGAPIALERIETKQRFTEPPSRYSEAGLIKVLEQNGVGRPSTYAPTVSLLEDREYITIEKKQITATDIAFSVIEMLEKHFGEIVDSKFTAKMEAELDEVAESSKDWQALLNEFYEPFMSKIKNGKTAIDSQKIAEEIGETCPRCGLPLVKRKGRFGEFISCKGYPQCKYARNLSGEEKKPPRETGEKCEKCGAPMVIREGRNGEFMACSAYPKCKNTRPLEGADNKRRQETIAVPCPKCGGAICKRVSKRGAFYGCSNYPKCDFIAKYEPTERKCEKCGYPMAKRVIRGKPVYDCVNSACKYRVSAEESAA
ncbi:MAG: type I DNA topoisomerase [Helicobacteraceae bacterium]|jgi:DNA topoisomerase-1|nr:type I DNA topoisomerase [Helicobacteraceae bacterium]